MSGRFRSVKPLSQEEKDRNRHSPATMYQFKRDPPSVFPSSLPGKFPDIDPCYSIPTEIWPKEWHIPPSEVRFGLIIENVSECLRPGFPSLNHVTHVCKRETRGVKVFQQASRSQNFIMYIGTNIPNSPYVNYLETSSITTLCQEMLGKVVAVGWPHCYGAKVVEISSRKERAFFKVRFFVISSVIKYKTAWIPWLWPTGSGPWILDLNLFDSLAISSNFSLNHFQIIEKKEGASTTKRTVTVAPNNEKGFDQQLGIVQDALLERWGIDIGETDWLIHAKPLIGRKLQYNRFVPQK